MTNTREPLAPAAMPEAERVNRWLESRFHDAREIHRFENPWGGYWYIVTSGRAFGVGATTDALEDARVIVDLNEFDSEGGFDAPPQLPNIVFVSPEGLTIKDLQS
jgi:hypothetical protein